MKTFNKHFCSTIIILICSVILYKHFCSSTDINSGKSKQSITNLVNSPTNITTRSKTDQCSIITDDHIYKSYHFATPQSRSINAIRPEILHLIGFSTEILMTTQSVQYSLDLLNNKAFSGSVVNSLPPYRVPVEREVGFLNYWRKLPVIKHNEKSDFYASEPKIFASSFDLNGKGEFTYYLALASRKKPPLINRKLKNNKLEWENVTEPGIFLIF